MIGTKIYKDNFSSEEYTECAIWCNQNSNVMMVDKGDYYECVEIVTSLKQLREAKVEVLKECRDFEELQPIECEGYLWDFDDKAQQRIAGAITVSKATGATFTWTSADDKEIENVGIELLEKVVVAAAIRSNELHIKYRTLKEQVNSLRSKDKIEAIQW